MAVPFAALALSGCTVAGSVVVEGEQLHVDVAVTERLPANPDEVPFTACGGGSPGFLAIADRTVTGDTASCRLHGTLTLGEAGVTHSDGRYALMLPDLDEGTRSDDPLTHLDLVVRFPGRVVELVGGTAGPGNSVRFSELGTARLVVAEDSDRPEPAVVAGAVGLALGLAAGFGGRWLALARRDRRGAPAASVAPGDEPGPQAPTPAPEDPAVWARSGPPADPPG